MKGCQHLQVKGQFVRDAGRYSVLLNENLNNTLHCVELPSGKLKKIPFKNLFHGAGQCCSVVECQPFPLKGHGFDSKSRAPTSEVCSMVIGQEGGIWETTNQSVSLTLMLLSLLLSPLPSLQLPLPSPFLLLHHSLPLTL